MKKAAPDGANIGNGKKKNSVAPVIVSQEERINK